MEDALRGKVALVTGASRGVGKGIALALGDAGAAVYISGRTLDEAESAVTVAGTITATAAEIAARGGEAIAVRCDHRDDAQVQDLFARIRRKHKRLDILVNNAWGGYEGYHNLTHGNPGRPFWKKPLAFWEENLDSVRWAYVSTVLALPMMIKQAGGLIVNISFCVPEMGNPAYAIAKNAVNRLTQETAHAARENGIATVGLHPGLVRTEGVLKNARYFDMTTSESPEYTGRAVVALASDAQVMEKSGQLFVVGNIAGEYGYFDVDGTRPGTTASKT